MLKNLELEVLYNVTWCLAYISKNEEQIPLKVEDFYNIVAQDYTFIKELNNVMKNYNIIIYYYPKQKINNVWSYGKIYLPINP